MTERKLTADDLKQIKERWAPYSMVDYALAKDDLHNLIHDLEAAEAEVVKLREIANATLDEGAEQIGQLKAEVERLRETLENVKGIIIFIRDSRLPVHPDIGAAIIGMFAQVQHALEAQAALEDAE